MLELTEAEERFPSSWEPGVKSQPQSQTQPKLRAEVARGAAEDVDSEGAKIK